MKKQRYNIMYEDEKIAVGINDTKFAICNKYGKQRNWFSIPLDVVKKLIDEEYLVEDIILRLKKQEEIEEDE